MSGQDIALVRSAFAAWSRGDLDAVGEFLAPDVKWHGGNENARDACHSRAEALSFMRRRGSREIRILDIVEAGDRLMVITQHPAQDGRLTSPRANLTRVRDGRVTEMIGYDSPQAALAAAGSQTPPRRA